MSSTNESYNRNSTKRNERRVAEDVAIEQLSKHFSDMHLSEPAQQQEHSLEQRLTPITTSSMLGRFLAESDGPISEKLFAGKYSRICERFPSAMT